MKHTQLVASVCLLVASLLGACAEESANDIPDRNAESKKFKGVILDELVEVIRIEEGAEGSPFVDGLESLLTFEEAFEIVKEQPHFVSLDSRIEKRGVCPGLRTRLLEVSPWVDLGMSGKLTLTFYNGILASARFGTANLAAYKAKSSAERGLTLRSVRQHRREPFTNAWIPVLPPYATVYTDIRMDASHKTIVKACRYQDQIEDGISEPPAEAS